MCYDLTLFFCISQETRWGNFMGEITFVAGENYIERAYFKERFS